jgi:hypothetical protein
MLLGLLAPPRKGPSTRPETLFCPLWLWRAKAKHWRIVASLCLQYRLHELHLTLRWPMFGHGAIMPRNIQNARAVKIPGTRGRAAKQRRLARRWRPPVFMTRRGDEDEQKQRSARRQQAPRRPCRSRRTARMDVIGELLLAVRAITANIRGPSKWRPSIRCGSYELGGLMRCWQFKASS